MHFERGSNYKQAVKYLQQAADNDIRRFAYQDASVSHAGGLELLWEVTGHARGVPSRNFVVQLTLGVPLIATEGYAAPRTSARCT